MTLLSFRLLEVDLTSGDWRASAIPASEVEAFLGGASLAARVLLPELDSSVEPLDPGAPLLIMTGPLTGTAGPSVGRFVVAGRSPATGLWGESNVGGFFGPELRASGWDAVLIRGRAATPVYLLLRAGGVEVRSASHLWGQTDTHATQTRLKAELGDAQSRVLCIGEAGERLLPFALVLCDHGRVGGRTGMGALMGSKNLKAIVARGSEPIPVIDPGGFARIRGEANRALRGDNVSRSLREFGTASAADYLDYLGGMPKQYFTRGILEGAEAITGATVAETILSGVSTCHGCVIACGRRVRLEDGAERKGPEYETMVGFGPNLGIVDLAAVSRLGELCDRYGVDTISMSNVIGLAIHLAEIGRLSAADADGLNLAWGDPAVAEALVHRTVRREGLGAWLAEGARSLAARCGAPDVAAEVKNLEVAYHDPRALDGMGLVYATSPRGACHNQSDYFMVEIGQTMEEIGIEMFSRQGGAEKAENVARHQDWRTLGNALVLCHLANVPTSTVVELVNAAVGTSCDLGALLKCGERGWTLKRLVNLRLGLKPGDDRLPGHLLRPVSDGGAANYIPPIEAMLDAYYQVRDWDRGTGWPSAGKLRELGLDGLASEPSPKVA